MADNKVFRRIEKKFILTDEQYQGLLSRISSKITADKYAEYTISNIYYDTEQNELIRLSLEKPKYKEKLRARSYGIAGDNDKIFVEIKKKYDGIVYKRRIKIRQFEWLKMLETKSASEVNTEGFSFTDKQIMKEIEYFIRFYDPRPAMYLAYDRKAFASTEDPDLRITFDFAIRARQEDVTLKKSGGTEMLLPEGKCLMEIKVPEAYPLWLVEALTAEKIYDVSFSKYGAFYTKFNIQGDNSNVYESVYNTRINNRVRSYSNGIITDFGTGAGTDIYADGQLL